MTERAEADGRVHGFPWPPVVILGVVTLVAVGVIAVRALWDREGDGPRVITDAAFVSAASAACADTLPPLRPPSSLSDNVSPAEAADQVARAADGLDALARRLVQLPVATTDQAAAVGNWLAEWKAFTDAGRDYAAEVRHGDIRSATEAARRGDPAQLRADRFARANDLDTCQLRPPFAPN